MNILDNLYIELYSLSFLLLIISQKVILFVHFFSIMHSSSLWKNVKYFSSTTSQMQVFHTNIILSYYSVTVLKQECCNEYQQPCAIKMWKYEQMSWLQRRNRVLQFQTEWTDEMRLHCCRLHKNLNIPGTQFMLDLQIVVMWCLNVYFIGRDCRN